MLGRATEAVDALRRLDVLSEALPAETTRAASTLYGWPEYRLRHTESYVHTYLGNTSEAYQAQDRAIALYPGLSDSVGRTLVQLHRARSMVLDGDIRDGVDHAYRAIDGLPGAFRSDASIQSVAGSVLDAVPGTERDWADVRTLVEMVRQP